MKKTFAAPERMLTIACFIFIGAFLMFGSLHLTKFVTADEHYWTYERIPQYFQALSEGKWKKTLINDKPGVTLALVAGTGLVFEPHPETHDIENDQDLALYESARTEKLLLSFRLPLLLFNAGMLLYLFWIIKKLTRNAWIALWAIAGIALSPILIGVSQILNPDALLWSAGAAALLTYLTSLRFPEKKRYVVLAAVFTGLGMLSKYTAAIFYPSFAFFLTAFILHSEFNEPKEARFRIRRHIANYAALFVGSSIVIACLLPAIFIKPIYLYRLLTGYSDSMAWVYIGIFLLLGLISAFTFIDKDTISRTIHEKGRRLYGILSKSMLLFAAASTVFLIIGRRVFREWPLFEHVPFDIKETQYLESLSYIPNSAETVLLNFNPLAFSLPPIIILLVCILWIRYMRPIKNESDLSFLTVSVTGFLLVFLITNTIAGVVATIRYDIILYPCMYFLAAISLWEIVASYEKPPLMRSFSTAVFAVALLVTTALSYPFYFNYTSDLLPKDKVIADAWGYGGYEAAQYINSQPDAKAAVIWADYYGVCEFIEGTCITDSRYSGAREVDYYVTTRRGEIRYNPSHVQWRSVTSIEPYKYYGRTDPAWELLIDSRPENYVRVYRANDERIIDN